MSAPDTAVDEAARARGKRVGLALVLGSAILFSAKAIFVKLSYPYGVDALTLLALRMGMALPVFAALAAVEEHRARAAGNAATARTYGVVAVLGAVGYWLASYLDFAGLAYVTASLERVVLFAYPTFTALLERALFGKKLGRAALVALLLSYAGIMLALGGEARVAGANTAIGAGLVLASAAAYACFLVGSGRVVGRYGATRLVAHAMTAACVVVLAHFALSHPIAALAQPPAVLGYAALTAVLSTVLPTVLLGHGIRRLGASQAAIAGSVGPVSTLALGAIFLGERITGPQVAGSALVLVGVTWLSVARRLARIRSFPDTGYRIGMAGVPVVRSRRRSGYPERALAGASARWVGAGVRRRFGDPKKPQET